MCIGLTPAITCPRCAGDITTSGMDVDTLEEQSCRWHCTACAATGALRLTMTLAPLAPAQTNRIGHHKEHIVRKLT